MAGLFPSAQSLFAAVPRLSPDIGASKSSKAPRLTLLPAASQHSVMERSLSRAGAVGDGKTIDTGAIQDAIAEVERNTRFEVDGGNTPFLGVGELVWPQGLFLVDDTIRITRSLRMRGEGQAEYSSGARIQQQRPGKDLFLVEPIAQGCSIGLSNMVLRANGGGLSGGALLRIAKAAGTCNTIRIAEVVLATPQSHAIDIANSDDVLISRCLFDVSGAQCIRMGLASPDGRVTNARITDNYFFSVAGECIELGKVEGVLIQSNNSFTESATRTFVKIRGETGKTQNIVVRGNSINKSDCLVDAAMTDGLIVESNIGKAMGAGVAPRRALVCLSGACAGVIVTGNRLQGEATLGLYDDAAAIVRDAVIANNAFTATGAHTAALTAANTQGRIGDNQIAGSARNGIGYRWTTANKSLSPGTVAAGAAAVVTVPVISALPGDRVAIDVLKYTLPDGVVLTSQADKDAVTVRYANVTQKPIQILPHDLAVMVTR